MLQSMGCMKSDTTEQLNNRSQHHGAGVTNPCPGHTPTRTYLCTGLNRIAVIEPLAEDGGQPPIQILNFGLKSA